MGMPVRPTMPPKAISYCLVHDLPSKSNTKEVRWSIWCVYNMTSFFLQNVFRETEPGAALLYATLKLEGVKLDSLDQQVGVDAIKAALKQPCIQIAQPLGF